MKTFKQLQDSALSWVDEVGNTDVLRDNIGHAIASAQRALLTERKWPFMRWAEPITFDITAGQQYYALHPLFFRAISFRNVTQDIPLIELTDETADRAGRQDNAQFVELRERWPVKAQPASADTIRVTSSSTSDGASQTLIVKGVDDDDEVVSATLTAGGAASTSAFKKIISVTKGNTAWNGTLTLSTVTGLETLLKLQATEYGKSYQTLYFRADVETGEVEYEFQRLPSLLVEDYDIPEVPPPFEDILTYRGLIQLATYIEPEANALKIWQAAEKELYDGLVSQYAEAHSLDRMGAYVSYIPRD